MNRETSYFYKDKLQTLAVLESSCKIGPLQFGGSTVAVREWYLCFFDLFAK